MAVPRGIYFTEAVARRYVEAAGGNVDLVYQLKMVRTSGSTQLWLYKVDDVQAALLCAGIKELPDEKEFLTQWQKRTHGLSVDKTNNKDASKRKRAYPILDLF